MMDDTQLYSLDRLAAENVMGWLFDHGTWVLRDETPTGHCNGTTVAGTSIWWCPTRDIAQAWKCLNEFIPGEFEVRIALHSKKWIAAIRDVTFLPPCGVYEGRAETAPLAIVIACLRAKGVGL